MRSSCEGLVGRPCSAPSKPFRFDGSGEIDALTAGQQEQMGENVGAFVRKCLALLVVARATVAPHAVQVDNAWVSSPTSSCSLSMNHSSVRCRPNVAA